MRKLEDVCTAVLRDIINYCAGLKTCAIAKRACRFSQEVELHYDSDISLGTAG
jgi:hypothetical protein